MSVVLKPAKDAAEFFANKKRRGFKKFNANLVNATAVSRDVHVDAPALSSAAEDQEQATMIPMSNTTTWSDPVAAGVTTKPIAASEQPSSAVRTLELAEDPNVVEKVQIEETKAKLAKAREGMERQAAAASAAPVAAAAPPRATRWMGARMRQGNATQQQNLDMGNTQLFPDLGMAAEPPKVQQRKPRMAARPKKAKPAMPPMVKPTDMDGAEAKPKEKEVPKTMKEIVAPEPNVVKKKKAKKDLSTFGKK